MDLVDLTANSLEFCDELADVVAWCTDPAALLAIVALVEHPQPAVRRAVAQALPRLSPAPRPDYVVAALVTLTADSAATVRECACHALGSRLSDVDTARVRDALAARLDDPDRHTRCEALLGLARRHDPVVVPALRTALAGDDVWLTELMAAGALGDPSLHPLVRTHLAGWSADLVPKVCATLRLTDPDGVGDDLLDGLAEWYRTPASPGIAARYWWSVALNLLEQAEDRAAEIATAVGKRLADSPDATARLASSMLGHTAAQHGWPPA